MWCPKAHCFLDSTPQMFSCNTQIWSWVIQEEGVSAMFKECVTFVKSERVQLCPVVSNSLQCHGLMEPPWSPAGSSVHGILQARILQCVAIPFSRESPWPRDQTKVSGIAGRFFTVWATKEMYYFVLPPEKTQYVLRDMICFLSLGVKLSRNVPGKCISSFLIIPH